MDEDRVWFKSRQGLDCPEVPRGTRFCAHAILDPASPWSSATRAATSAFTTIRWCRRPALRFYAGQPLLSPEGHALGTFCIVDRESHAFSDQQRAALRDLAKMAEAELTTAELNQALGRAARGGGKLPRHLRERRRGHFPGEREGRYLNANPAAARFYGYDSTADFMEHARISAGQQVNPSRRATCSTIAPAYGA